MPRRASVKGKGTEIFYSDAAEAGAGDAGAAHEEAPSPANATAAAPQKTPAAPAKTHAKPSPEAPPVKTPAVTIAYAPPTPAAKTPAPLRPAPADTPAPRTPPPPSHTRPPAAAVAPASAATTPAQYERLAQEIDRLYEMAARKVASGQGVGQCMQWLRDARRLVMSGRSADFAQAELLVRHVGGLLKHGDEVDNLYEQALEQVGDSPDLLEQCMGLLHEARQKITMGHLEDLIEAEFLMEKVKGLLIQVQKSRAASATWGTRFLWLWLVGWLIFLLAAFIFDKPLAEWLYARGLRAAGDLPPTSVAELMLPWLCLIWGGVGSVFDTLVAINEHMAKRTYDGHYIAQGFASPMYGALLGTLTYFLVAGGVMAIGTGLAFSSTGRASSTAELQANLTTAARSVALWTISFLFGFFHKRTMGVLETVFDQILSGLQILPAPEPPAPPQTPPAPPISAPKPPVEEPGAALAPGSPVLETPSPVVAAPPTPPTIPVSPAPPAPPLPPDGPPIPETDTSTEPTDLGDL